MSHIHSTDDHATTVPTPHCSTTVGHGRPTGAPTHALVHVPYLLLPHGRLAVSSLQEMPTHNGTAWVADLTIDDRFAGSIESDGNGGATAYFGLNSGPFTSRDLRDYVLACRHQGRTPTEEFVLNALVDEYDLAHQVASAFAAHATVVRLLDAEGHTLQTHLVQPAPITQAQWDAVADQVQALPRLLTGGRIWQMWTGSAWCHLTDAPPEPSRP
jgi:hypothetical protein